SQLIICDYVKQKQINICKNVFLAFVQAFGCLFVCLFFFFLFMFLYLILNLKYMFVLFKF
ncbi:MAG: hypothetical protein N7Q72_06090, partial [Spiroplasma sp. Tabriz.8]|nr:hypothetical protein [Spiroplasma sp. Tabriz.8]